MTAAVSGLFIAFAKSKVGNQAIKKSAYQPANKKQFESLLQMADSSAAERNIIKGFGTNGLEQIKEKLKEDNGIYSYSECTKQWPKPSAENACSILNADKIKTAIYENFLEPHIATLAR